ncbi:cell division inhibitor SulA [Neptunomonas japonica]|uniref:Cell division inhibitor SulA n=1 Tax=Neptunomonas japonica JAMM 1380 TaxID=1441457 RepID=A0A7R6P976_9GAMM|nr:SulA-like leucine-rich domain-containing protein [Neptunomonas japonica]BBB29569.1 cell division inhibitor SulA [Neptunomonas japonica JAMM 1380]
MIQLHNHRNRPGMALLRKHEQNQIHQKPPATKKEFGKITEIVTRSGELNDMPLLMPLLAQLSHEDRWFAWVAPPTNLPRSLLQDAGIDLNKVILLYPDEHHSVLQLAKKALSTGTCHAVISWAEEISEHEIKNLEHSAQQGCSNGILIRRRHH